MNFSVFHDSRRADLYRRTVREAAEKLQAMGVPEDAMIFMLSEGLFLGNSPGRYSLVLRDPKGEDVAVFYIEYLRQEDSAIYVFSDGKRPPIKSSEHTNPMAELIRFSGANFSLFKGET